MGLLYAYRLSLRTVLRVLESIAGICPLLYWLSAIESGETVAHADRDFSPNACCHSKLGSRMRYPY